MIKVIRLFVLLLFVAPAFGQKEGGKKTVPWLSPQQVAQHVAQNPKPLIIDVYTDWCHYCKLMDKTTWSHPQLRAYVAENFYPLKFNAESKEEVAWMGKTYAYKPAYKVHMLAAEWLKGNMVFPSTVIIPADGESIILPGMMSPAEMEPVLRYFGEGYYKTTTWQSFKEAYKTTWKKA
jgi:thioredoxin-related protein